MYLKNTAFCTGAAIFILKWSACFALPCWISKICRNDAPFSFSKTLEVDHLVNRSFSTQCFFFFRKEQAPSFISTPSSPLYPAENDNITLQWTYTLDGSPLDQVEVLFTPDSPSFSVLRVASYRSGGTTLVANDFQDRFVFHLTDSQSTVIIHHSQRSDSGKYELSVIPDDVNLASIWDEVEISVKCKWKWFSLTLKSFLKYEELFSNLGIEALFQVEAQGFFPFTQKWSRPCASLRRILVNRGKLRDIHGL